MSIKNNQKINTGSKRTNFNIYKRFDTFLYLLSYILKMYSNKFYNILT